MVRSISERALERVAQTHNVTVEEVMRQIEEAYSVRKKDELSDRDISASEIVEKLSRIVANRLQL